MKPFQPRAGFCGLIAMGSLWLGHAPAKGQTPEQIMAAGQVHESRLETPQALQLYLQAEKVQPANADLLVKIARQYRHLMAETGSAEEKLRLGNIALEYGRRAARIAPDNSDAQLSVAISYGKMLPYQGTREQVECSKFIKQGAERAIRLNPRNDLAWHIIGRWHRNVADISGFKKTLASLIYEKLPDASHAEALACLEKALAINPNRVIHYIELGRTHAMSGNKEQARKYLTEGLKRPTLEKDDFEAKALGRQLLAEL